MADNEISDGILDVLRLYHEHAAKLLALSVVDFDEFPDGVLNEIRAAFTHLAAAAHGENLSFEQRKAELHDACGHLNRVSLDAIKILVVERSDAIRQLRKAIEKIHPLSRVEYRELKSLQDRRRTIVTWETKNPGSPQTVLDFINLFEDLSKFQEKLEENGTDHEVRATAKRLSRERSGATILAWVLFILGLVGSYATAQWGGPTLPRPSFIPASWSAGNSSSAHEILDETRPPQQPREIDPDLQNVDDPPVTPSQPHTDEDIAG